MPTTTGSRYFAEALAAYGVTHVFMVPTVAVRALAEMDAVGITVVMNHSEKAAAYAADGYARATGRPGICLAQTVGAANLASGLRDARLAGSPVIAFTGGRSGTTKHRHVYQELPDLGLFDPVTKANLELDDVRRLPDLLRQAFRAATSGSPGPVHIEVLGHEAQVLEDDLEVGDATGPMAEARFACTPSFRPAAEADAVVEAVRLLVAAERPVVVAGGGVRVSGAGGELVALVERLGIPVATSLDAKGTIAEDHPLALGVVGAYSRAPANQGVLEADLVFYVGSRTGSQVTGGWVVPPASTPVVQLDIDPEELGRNYPNVVSLCGDARVVLRQMLEEAGPAPDPAADATPHPRWRQRASELVATWRTGVAERMASGDQPIRPERLCRDLTDVLPADGVLVSDTGHAGIWSGSLVDLRPGQLYLRAAGSLGWSIPASLGAQCALADRPVVCFTGDGGAYYHLTELETMGRMGIPVTVVVNDNRSFSQDMRIFDRAYDGAQTAAGLRMWMFEQSDFAAAAAALGCRGVRVEKADELRDVLADAVADPRPVLVDVVTDLQALPDRPVGGVTAYGVPW